MTAAPTAEAALLHELAGVVGAPHLVGDPVALERLSVDYSLEAATAAAASVSPASLGELAEVVVVAGRHGAGLAARGGGMSYTRAHTPTASGTVLVDTRRLDRIVAIDTVDLTVTVEAGCTWEQLYLALRPKGVRTAFWGPLSGHSSTIGGAMSQNAAFLGSAGHGSAADGVLGLTVVLADGRVLRTGASARRGGTVVDRHFGPDLTGLFLCDAGTMGIKAEVTLALIPAPTHAVAATWAATDIHQALDIMTAVARPGAASDIYAFDSYYHRLLAGQGFEAPSRWPWTVNVVVEGLDGRVVDDQLELLRRQVPAATRELGGSVPLAMRADPFGATRTMFQAEARSVHLPVHGILPPSAAHAAAADLVAFADERREQIDGNGIGLWTMLVAVGRRLILEPTLFYEGGYHDRGSDPERLRVVRALRRELAQRLAHHGATHNQVGRYYPLAELVEPVSWECLVEVKQLFDPHRLLNDGALGLGGGPDDDQR